MNVTEPSHARSSLPISILSHLLAFFSLPLCTRPVNGHRVICIYNYVVSKSIPKRKRKRVPSLLQRYEMPMLRTAHVSKLVCHASTHGSRYPTNRAFSTRHRGPYLMVVFLVQCSVQTAMEIITQRRCLKRKAASLPREGILANNSNGHLVSWPDAAVSQTCRS
jgi:hypothetical protein